MPVDVNGLFVLTLKFSEVYFERSGQKIFSVMLNDHIIIKDLDVFKEVGKNAAYDRQVEFRVSNSSSEIIFESAKGSSKPAVSVPYDGTLNVRFVSSGYVSRPCDLWHSLLTPRNLQRALRKDNPKVNALLVTQGSLGNHLLPVPVILPCMRAVLTLLCMDGDWNYCKVAPRLKHVYILTATRRVVAVAAFATADLQVQQIPQRKERDEKKHEDESSGELGLGAHFVTFEVHVLSVYCCLVRLTTNRGRRHVCPCSFCAWCSCDGCVDMLFGSMGVRTVG